MSHKKESKFKLSSMSLFFSFEGEKGPAFFFSYQKDG